ncbi:MAG: adenine phosphoribosyltransferase [Ruminococcaceae bacterium]|nr:adenine phosphoribosyltransferase [Oscillospiraceae bacterium]
MKTSYLLKLAGIERELPLCKVNDELQIAAFVMFGDVELTEKAAAALLELAPEHDIIITAESKGIPLAYEMAKQSGNNNYVVARKAPKLYMRDVVYTHVKSITTVAEQLLCIGSDEAALLKGKRVLIVDDVISTGGSIASVVQLVNQVGGNIVGKMAVLAEGDAMARKDIIALQQLPLFDGEGNIK